MKRLWMLLLVLLLLTGCSQPQVSVDPDTGQEDQQDQKDPVKITPALLETAQPVGTSGNLWYIQNNHVEALNYPSLYMVGDNLLLVEYQYDSYDNCVMLMKLLDLDTGELIAESKQSCSGNVRVQVMEDCIGLSDPGMGWVRIMDHSLQLKQNYELDGDWGDWVLGPDLKNVYELHWEHGISRINLSMKVRVPLLEAREPGLMSLKDDQFTLSYLDKKTQRYRHSTLDMTTGTIAPLELPVGIGWAITDGNNYLVNESGQWDRYHVFAGTQHYTMASIELNLRLLTTGGHLYTTDMESRRPTVYSMDGKLVSCADVPGGEWVNSEPVWCEDWGGYFMITTTEENRLRLVFWDPKVMGVGTDLPMELYQAITEKPHTAEESMYQRAQQLSKKYGVDIRIAEQCALDYDEFTGMEVTDSETLKAALDTLETALSGYPEGFFQQLLYGRLDNIRIELIKGLKRKDWPDDVTYTSFAAFAQEKSDHYLVVMDVNASYLGSYYHEFSHIIDRRLEWDGIYRPDALYTEADWLNLQPEGFTFSYNYQSPPENWNDYLGWFVDDYAMTMPTEDRARVMEYAMSGWDWHFADRKPLISKLEYYSKCIRDCFDTTGWPERTLWEQTLDRAKAQ